jgi:hypothetical protein
MAMIEQLPAFVVAVMGDEILYILVLLVGYVLLINIKRTVITAIQWYEDR